MFRALVRQLGVTSRVVRLASSESTSVRKPIDSHQLFAFYLQAKSNDKTSFESFLKEKCSADECVRIANCLYAASFPKDIPQAVKLWQATSARNNHPGATFSYAMALRSGLGGTERDSKQAATLLQSLLPLNLPHVSFALAQMYHAGEGVDRNAAEALRLFQLAGKAGLAEGHFSAGSMLTSGEGVPKDDQQSTAEFEAAATKHNHGGAKFNIALRYLRGSHGLPKDTGRAMRMFMELSQDGGSHAGHAAHAAGAALLSGDGVEKNIPAAVQWFDRGAARGFVPSMINLALLYSRGEGVPKSMEVARRWLEVAAPHSQHAKQLLDQMFGEKKE